MKYKDVEGILYNYKIIVQRINVMESEIKRMTEESISFQSDIDGMPRGTDTGNPTEKAALRLTMKKEMKQNRIDKDKLLLEKINRAFHVLSPDEQRIINTRYLERKMWNEVAEECGYSISHVKRMRRIAIEKMVIVLN